MTSSSGSSTSICRWKLSIAASRSWSAVSVSSAISRSATTGFLSLSRSTVSGDAGGERPGAVRREHDELEAVRHLVDAVFNGYAGHTAAPGHKSREKAQYLAPRRAEGKADHGTRSTEEAVDHHLPGAFRHRRVAARDVEVDRHHLDGDALRPGSGDRGDVEDLPAAVQRRVAAARPMLGGQGEEVDRADVERARGRGRLRPPGG